MLTICCCGQVIECQITDAISVPVEEMNYHITRYDLCVIQRVGAGPTIVIARSGKSRCRLK